MLVPIEDREQLKAILRDIETRFAALPLFQAGRREIVEACARHAAVVCEAMVSVDDELGWLDASSPHISKASDTLFRLTRAFRTILSTATLLLSSGNGRSAREAVTEAFEVANRFAIIARALRHMVKRGAWGTSRFDADTRELVLAPQDDEIQARESYNSERLRTMEQQGLQAGLKRGLSAEADPADVHLNEVDRLNPAYTRNIFGAVMRAVREKAFALAHAKQLCVVAEMDRTTLEQEIAERSGLMLADVSSVIDDLLFRFDPKQDGEQFLLEIEPGRVAVIPLLVIERTHDATDYVRISKTHYPSAYAAHQNALTHALEDRVGAALRVHSPSAEVRPLKLPGSLGGGTGGQIDQVAADSAEDALLFVQVKYLLDHDNGRIAEGVRQLQRDERVMRERWPTVAKALTGWGDRPFPAHVGKLLVTNWFVGTEAVPKDIRVLTLDDLRAMPSSGSLRGLIERLSTLPEPRLVPQHEQRISLLGYTFIHYTARA